MEYFPFYPSAFSFPEPLGQGPSLAISRTCTPSLPNPVLSLNCHHPLVRPLLPRGDLLRGPGPLSEIWFSSAPLSCTIPQAHLCVWTANLERNFWQRSSRAPFRAANYLVPCFLHLTSNRNILLMRSSLLTAAQNSIAWIRQTFKYTRHSWFLKLVPGFCSYKSHFRDPPGILGLLWYSQILGILSSPFSDI